VKPESKRKWVTVFSLLLWAQLIFSGGLTLWRYQLIHTQNWPVYPSDNSPQLDQFAAFIKTVCSDETAIGYISTEYNSFARLNYELYPRPVHNLSSLTENEVQTAIAENEIRCLVYDYASGHRQIEGSRHDFSGNQYVLQLEPAE
jgi:hypothetical protein